MCVPSPCLLSSLSRLSSEKTRVSSRKDEMSRGPTACASVAAGCARRKITLKGQRSRRRRRSTTNAGWAAITIYHILSVLYGLVDVLSPDNGLTVQVPKLDAPRRESQ